MSTKMKQRVGWTITILIALLIAFSAFLKLSLNEMATTQAKSMGIDDTTYQIIGVIELVSLILFLIPRTGVVGSLLLIAYMGGAIATHLQHQQPFIVPVIIESLVWISAALRFPELVTRLFGALHKK